MEEWFYPRPHTTLSLIKQNNRSDLPSNKDPSATAKGESRKIDFHKIALNISKELGFFTFWLTHPTACPDGIVTVDFRGFVLDKDIFHTSCFDSKLYCVALGLSAK